MPGHGRLLDQPFFGAKSSQTPLEAPHIPVISIIVIIIIIRLFLRCQSCHGARSVTSCSGEATWQGARGGYLDVGPLSQAHLCRALAGACPLSEGDTPDRRTARARARVRRVGGRSSVGRVALARAPPIRRVAGRASVHASFARACAGKRWVGMCCSFRGAASRRPSWRDVSDSCLSVVVPPGVSPPPLSPSVA